MEGKWRRRAARELTTALPMYVKGAVRRRSSRSALLRRAIFVYKQARFHVKKVAEIKMRKKKILKKKELQKKKEKEKILKAYIWRLFVK